MTSGTETTFGRFRLLREIGRGGEATVHLADDPRLGRRVAIKIFPPTATADSTDLPAGFRKEVEILSRLGHPGIPTIHDAGVEDGCAFIAMSYVEGRTLAEWTGISHAEAVRIGVDVAASLSAAHRVGVVHGDLKPSNVVVATDGRAVVLDFGVARLLDQPVPAQARFGGTLPYLAPERLAAPPDVGADVFGLGAVLFELVAARPPFTAPTRAALIRQLETAEAPLLRTVAPGAGRDLEAVLAKALDRDPLRRYRTMADFGADLVRVRDGERVTARRYGPLARIGRWARSNKAAAAVVAFGVLFLTIAAATAVLKNRELSAHLENAGRAAARAGEERRAAEESKLRYERLADARRLIGLEARAARLVPPTPAILPELTAWLTDARSFAGRIDDHRQALASVRSRATSRTPVPLGGPFRNRIRELDDLRLRLPILGAMPAEDRAVRALIERLEKSLPVPVEQASYADPSDAWQDEVLSRLIGEIDRFADSDPFRGVLSDVSRRVDEVRELEAELAGTSAEWERARRSIADPVECPRYRGLNLAPQLGLVPLRRDPRSGLWEFRHVLSGDAPRDPEPGESLEVTAATGIVLVLLPGGDARMGARPPRKDEPPGPHVDPLAGEIESTIDDVPLDPFFMSKYEMTETQWVRLRGALPGPDLSTPGRTETRRASVLPVASIDWNEARTALVRVGLELPTEAQWEYAARAGTTTPWWTGADPSTLGSTSVFATNHPATVGRRAPNAFGLHDVTGNVHEWCCDLFARYRHPRLAGTGERIGLQRTEHRILRGGAFSSHVNELRSAWRGASLEREPSAETGIRPARRIDRHPPM